MIAYQYCGDKYEKRTPASFGGHDQVRGLNTSIIHLTKSRSLSVAESKCPWLILGGGVGFLTTNLSMIEYEHR